MEDILQTLTNNRLIIYGTGYAAHNFYVVLKHNQLEKNIESFVVSKVQGEKELFGIRIQSLEDIEETEKFLFCIATHEAILPEIESRLRSRDIQNYIWVHPYIFRLGFGNPIEEKKLVDVKTIIQSQKKDNYFLAIRYLAIENFFQKNKNGFDIYRKALQMQCERNTAEKRVLQFKQLIVSWEQNGYSAEFPITIDRKKRLIDGAHRFSMACYFNLEDICCDILPVSDMYSEIVKESHLMSENTIGKVGFSDEEIEIIKRTQIKILEKYS